MNTIATLSLLAQKFFQHKIVRYLMSGGTAAVVHIGTVFIATYFFHIWYIYATCLGFLLAVTLNFLLQKFWTFQNIHTHAKAMTQQSLSFAIVAGCNFFLNAALMYVAVDIIGFYPVIGQCVVAITIAFESFIAYSFIFRA